MPKERASGGNRMKLWLGLSDAIDALNEKISWIADYLVLLACLVSAANAASRYAFSISSNAFLEIQWYMFAGMVLLGGPFTLKMNEHVRVDLVYASVSERKQLWIDAIGIVLFLLPVMVYLIWLCLPYFWSSYLSGEGSTNAGGLILWPVKLLILVGFTLMLLQGISELIKRIAALRGIRQIEAKYVAPQQ
jgi:TRAP-type mannitol/chloroaromatic compound transport system permease small subunit